MEEFSFGIGLKSNKESNDFLRCLWSRISQRFGKLAWQYSPSRFGTSIYIGQACISDDVLLSVRLNYRQRGCLSSITFEPHGYKDVVSLKNQLKQCIEEAFQYEQYLCKSFLRTQLDKNISFIKKEGKYFCVEGNNIVIRVQGFDREDCSSIFKIQFQQVCNLLTYDTLRYITSSGTLTEEIRSNHNFRASLVDGNTRKKTGAFEKNDMFQNLVVSDSITECIDAYLERSYLYENHFSNFDKSVQLFAQGVRNEELSYIVVGLPEPYAEQAIVNYMSALEVITLNDKEPEKCECCGQMKYSIARRVIDLMKETIPGGETFAKRFYKDRSKYVHTGTLLSSNNYINRSIPLMSINSMSGMIGQIPMIDFNLKEVVKMCIEKHENGNVPLQSKGR